MIKYIGVTLILSAAYLLFSEIKRRAELSLLESEEMLRFVHHIRRRIECYLSPMSEWCVGFESEPLSKAGILCGGIFEIADALAKDSHLLSKKICGLLSEYFKSAGDGYMESETERVKALETELDGCIKEMKADVSRRVKCYGIIIASIALGIVILLI